MKICLNKSRSFSLLLTIVAIAGNLLAANKPRIAPRKDYADVAGIIKPFIEQQIKQKQIPAISIAVVDDQQIVWAEGFGFADQKAKIPATAETVYRIGSVSKLFTDIGIMQMVERGALDLDAPVTNYIPDFHPKNPFGAPITLRQLMSHQSGLLREPPIGNYFETSEPSLKQTVLGLNETQLVYAPGTHVKYSNAAIGAVGYVLEEKNGLPFAKYLKSAVLAPLGMEHSSFGPESALIHNLAKAEMWSYDGRVFDAPTFQLGMAPAGSMYSTVNDLGRFVIAMLAHGQGERGQVLKPETLDQMWQPQSPNSSGGGFGLGFRIADLNHHRMIGHGGAIYGFATSLEMLPDDKLGVIVVATKDVANGVTERIAQETLRLILDHRQGKPLTAPQATTRVPSDLARKLAGRYGSGDDAVDLDYLNGKLTMLRVNGGSQVELRQLGNDPSAETSGQVLVADSLLGYGTVVTPLDHAIRLGDKVLERVQVPKPAAAPGKWQGLMGEYGWDHDTLYVFEKNGRLSVLIEWIEYDALAEVSQDVFEFPQRGLYEGEKAIFIRGANGEATQVQISGVIFKRRQIGGVSGGVFRIQPARSIPVLRKEALADHPPAEKGDMLQPDLVELASLDPTIKLDVRYASTNNFLSEPLYSQARAFLQRPAAEAVVSANRALKKLGFGLLIHDAYRPWYVTKMFWEATPPDKRIFVANPREGSRHNRGCAVDLSLYDLATGKPIEMVGVYDEMSERSYPGYPGGTSLQRWHRDLLRSVMEQQGFEVYEFEWWHFDYKDWRRYPVLNLTFDQISPLQSQDRHE